MFAWKFTIYIFILAFVDKVEQEAKRRRLLREGPQPPVNEPRNKVQDWA
jgi:hypothetical protein